MADIASYLELIQYQGPYKATQDVLRALHIRHTRAIAFECLSPFTGTAVSLDVDALIEKFTVQKRGGYCYEHNTLFQHILRDIGFKAQGLAARVRLNIPVDVATPRTHMLLLVEAQGESFIADTGFGRLTLTAPIRLVPNIVQDTPHGPYRLIPEGDGFCLQTKSKADWQDLYIFDLTPYHSADYEVCNWYTSTHPQSSFVNELIAARPVPTGRHVLHNRQYSFYRLNGQADRRQLDSLAEIKHLLENEFRIATSGLPRLDARLSELLAA